MQGYDQEAAVRYITGKIGRSAHKGFSPSQIDSLLRKAVEYDLQYMKENGVIGPESEAGDSFYDDDEAFEYISDNLCKVFGGNDETAMRICALVDDYMDLQEEYMEQSGLVEWE